MTGTYAIEVEVPFFRPHVKLMQPSMILNRSLLKMFMRHFSFNSLLIEVHINENQCTKMEYNKCEETGDRRPPVPGSSSVFPAPVDFIGRSHRN